MKDIETYKILNEESIKKYLLALKKNSELMNYVNSLKKRINELATIKYDYEELFEYYKKALKQLDNNPKEEMKNKCKTLDQKIVSNFKNTIAQNEKKKNKNAKRNKAKEERIAAHTKATMEKIKKSMKKEG